MYSPVNPAGMTPVARTGLALARTRRATNAQTHGLLMVG